MKRPRACIGPVEPAITLSADNVPEKLRPARPAGARPERGRPRKGKDE